MWMVWFALAALFVIVELNLGTFYLLVLAVSALLSMIFDLLGFSYLIQWLVFVVAAFCMYIFLMPILRKGLPKSKNEMLTVDEELVGKSAFVISDIIPGGGGQVKVDSDIWSAIADEPILKGERVIILEVRVSKLYVKKSG